MDDLTYMWVAMIGLVAVSVFAFVGLTILAWHDNVLLVKHWIERFRYYRSRIRHRWRRWREPEFRIYDDLVERFMGAVMLLSSLVFKEEVFQGLEKIADSDKEREHYRREYEKFHQARIKSAPHIAKHLAAFTDDELVPTAEALAGFDFDHRPQTEHDQGRTEHCLESIKAARTTLHRESARGSGSAGGGIL